MGKHGLEKQGVEKQSQATSVMGVEIAASDGCRTSRSRLLAKNKRSTTGAELIGINADNMDSSKLVSVVGSDHESITSNGDDGKPPAVATNKLVPFAVVVSLGWSRASRTVQRCYVSHTLSLALLFLSRVFNYSNQAWRTWWLVPEWTT
jgi:hypothetical protein